MKRLSSLWLVFATFFVAQTSFATCKTRELQVDVLVLDATMALAKMGAAGGMYAAWEAMPRGTPEADSFHRKVDVAAETAVLGSCPTCDSLKWVSKDYTPWLARMFMGPFASSTDGTQVAREAANRLAQSAHPETWGPDLLWAITKEAARAAIKQKRSEEEIGRAAAQASWAYVLNMSGQIDEAVRNEISVKYLADEFDAKQVLASLKQAIDTVDFKEALPEAQDFYRDSVANLERKLRDQHLVD